MMRTLPLHRMMHGISFEGTVLIDEALPFSEVAQRIKEATEPTKDSKGGVLDMCVSDARTSPNAAGTWVLRIRKPSSPVLFLFLESPYF